MRRVARDLLLLVFVGCGGPDAPDVEGPSTSDGTTTRAAVVDGLFFARDLSPGVSEGFDLDGVVSSPGDPEGCLHADRTSPDGTPGIDNAFAGLIPVLDATEASAIEPLVQGAIAAGDLLVLVELDGLDDPVNDDCVDVTLVRGERATPLLGPDGRLLDGQTFLPVDGARSTVTCVPLVDGVLQAGPFTLDLPIRILDVELALGMRDAQLRLALDPDGSMRGVLGGAVPLEGILVILEEDDLGDLRDLVEGLILLAADLWPGEAGCDALSVTFELTATLAFVAGD